MKKYTKIYLVNRRDIGYLGNYESRKAGAMFVEGPAYAQIFAKKDDAVKWCERMASSYEEDLEAVTFEARFISERRNK